MEVAEKRYFHTELWLHPVYEMGGSSYSHPPLHFRIFLTFSAIALKPASI